MSARFDSRFDFVFEATAECLELQQTADELTTKIKMANLQANDLFNKRLHDPECSIIADVVDSVLMSTELEVLERDITQREQAVADELAEMPLHIRLQRNPEGIRIHETFLSGGPQGMREQSVKNKVRKADGVFRTALLGRNALLLLPLPRSGSQTNFGGLLAPVLRSDGEPNISISLRPRGRRDVMLGQSNLMSHEAFEDQDMHFYKKLASQFR